MKDLYEEYDEICKFVKGLNVFTALTIANKFDMSVLAAEAKIKQMIKEGKVEQATLGDLSEGKQWTAKIV